MKKENNLKERKKSSLPISEMIVNVEKCTNKLFTFTKQLSMFSMYKNPY